MAMKKILFGGLVLLWGTGDLLAQEFEGTRGIALSGALRGTVGLNESIYYNPAAFAFSQKYSIEAQSFYAPSQDAPATWVYNASVLDAHNDFLAAGFGYTRKTRPETFDAQPSKEVINAFHLAASKIFGQFISVGLTGKYFLVNHPTQDQQALNFDVGAFGVLTPDIQVGLIAYNLLGDKRSPSQYFLTQRHLGLGSRLRVWKFLYGSLDFLKRARADWSKDFSFHGALEIVRNNGVVVQGGLSLSDQKAKNFYSLGLGWAEYKFGISYAFQNSMNAHRSHTHALSLRTFF